VQLNTQLEKNQTTFCLLISYLKMGRFELRNFKLNSVLDFYVAPSMTEKSQRLFNTFPFIFKLTFINRKMTLQQLHLQIPDLLSSVYGH